MASTEKLPTKGIYTLIVFLSSDTQLKVGHNSELYEKVPEGHSVWEVIWWLRYQTKPGGYDVIVIVDAETATIIHEEKGILLL